METKQLRTFLTIIDTESFTRAGRRLGLSQSAISQQIGALERQLGVKLLRRTGAGAKPSAAGEILAHYARQVVRKIDEAQRVLSDFDTNGSGVLRVGAGGAACHYLLPQILKEMRRLYPKLDLHVVSGPTQTTVERLLEAELDVGILTLPVTHARLRIVPVGRDELVAIVAPAHPWSTNRRIQATDFADQPLLIYERRSQTYRLIERVLLEVGVFPKVAMEMDHLEAVTAMVRDGLGVAIVPRWAICEELAAAQLVALPIGRTGLSRAWGLAVMEQDHQPLALKALLRLCSDRLPPMLSGEPRSCDDTAPVRVGAVAALPLRADKI
jgi:DNA-binding transcriptional LysR family regulator